MKKIFDYISNNSFLVAIIGIVVGWLLNFLSSIYFKEKENKKRYLDNRPELYLGPKSSLNASSVELFFGEGLITKNLDRICLNKHKLLNYKDFYIKNIGKSNIDFLYITVLSELDLIIDVKYINKEIYNKCEWTSYCYDNKIMIGDEIKIRIYYDKDFVSEFKESAQLVLLYVDQNHNSWEQEFFLVHSRIYPPFHISSKKLWKKISK